MLSKLTNKYDVILASQSPRRQQLLQEIINHFTVEVREVEEIFPKHLQEEEIAIYLSQLKSKAFKIAEGSKQLIITADTIVCIDDEVLGKPKDEIDAFSMLKKLNGRTHAVITGVTIATDTKTISFADKTLVTFHQLSDEEIHYYIDKCHPFDKAGSYGIQEWFGYVGIEKMEGEFFNVMGLPTHLLYQELKNFI